MRKVNVKAEREYEVSIDVEWIDEISNLMQGRSRTAIITSAGFTPDLTQLLQLDSDVHHFTVPDGEDGKSFSTLTKLWDWLGAAGFTRSDLIVAVGGGALTDLAGFAAATWLRGIDWIAVPTSLAGMVDASIGGKTGINSDYGKNLIGAFHSPISVVIDPMWLQTLSDRDFSAGMAEVIKCGFISDYKILNLVQDDVIDFNQLIYRAVKVKAKVVAKDFKESKLREILNYGHTLGHAIEKDSKFRLRHGEAVSIGMVFAAELSNELVGLSKEVVDLHRVLSSNFKLPISYPKSRWKSLSALLLKDKKVKQGKVRFIGISKIGKPVWLEDVPSNTLARVYERITK